jgi:hypothetical protein
VAAADVGDFGAGGQFGLDAVEGGQPAGDQIGGVPGPEEALAAREHLVVVLVPADARTGAERLDDLLLRPQRAERELERARREDGPVGSVRAKACSGVRE